MPEITTSRPLQEAVGSLSRRTPLGSKLTSAEWALLPAEIRQRAMFSARVEDERLLAAMQERLLARVELAKRDGRTVDRGVFIEEMREELKKSGYKRADGVQRGSLRDLKSSRRLGLIWDMNLAQAQGYARWKADMTPEGLENEPCYELIRGAQRVARRLWPEIWARNGGEFYDGPGSNEDYPNSPGRMIALKTSDIWRKISRFGTPWAPLDWGSGMVLRGVDRDESDAFGITGPADVFEPQDSPFNAGVRASVKEIPQEGRQRLLDALAGDVEIVDDEIRLLPPEVLPRGFRIPAPPAELTNVAARAEGIVAGMDAEKRATMLAELGKTAAYQTLKSQAGADWDETAALVRATTQFLAERGGLGGLIREARRGPVRNAWWTVADFFGVAGLLIGWIGGAA